MGKVQYMIRAALIAAIYVIITYILKPISYGPLQIRISEALTLLPVVESSAVLGLFIGCFMANLLGGMGPWDIYLGSLITLVSAYLTSKTDNPFLGAIPPIVLNMFGVSLYVSKLSGIPYFLTALTIGVGQFIAVLGIGIPIFIAMKKTGLIKFFKKDTSK